MLLRALYLLTCAATLAAAHVPPAIAANDPLEPLNRRVYGFNRVVQANVLGPLAERYRSLTAPALRHGVANALSNLREPITALSSLASGNLEVTANALARFAINSSVGLAGAEDRAAEMGYPRRPFTLADAACAWGVPSGPFLMLPLLGPSTVRDAGALGAQTIVLDQTLGADLYLTWSSSDLFISYAQLHPELKRIESGTLDPYAVYRSLYLQQRASTCPVDRPLDRPAGPTED